MLSTGTIFVCLPVCSMQLHTAVMRRIIVCSLLPALHPQETTLRVWGRVTIKLPCQ